MGTWTAQQRALLANEPKEFSRTLRELLALDYALDCIRANTRLADSFRHRHLVYKGDSQVMQACINKMGGNRRDYEVVKRIWEAAFELDLGLEMQWRPRETTNQMLADSLEKQMDPGDWVASPEILQAVSQHLAVGQRPFTLDTFASDTNTKVPGRFYSKWLCKDTLGVDAFGHSWAANGPFSDMGRILKKIREERCDAALLHPVSSSYWAGMLCSLPVKAQIHVTTAHIAAGIRQPSCGNTLNFAKLTVSIILWYALCHGLYTSPDLCLVLAYPASTLLYFQGLSVWVSPKHIACWLQLACALGAVYEHDACSGAGKYQ